jgi:hypothetical protein
MYKYIGNWMGYLSHGVKGITIILTEQNQIPPLKQQILIKSLSISFIHALYIYA